MEKLPICRICLASDLRMELLIDTHLQDVYEKLTLTSFETKDIRPVQVCYICYARLQNCYLLKMNCLHSEELFTHMIADNQLLTSVNIQELCGTPRLVKTSVVVESFCEATPNDFGFKMEVPESNIDVQVEFKMEVQDVVTQADEGLSDHRESDTEDEISLDKVKLKTPDGIILQEDEEDKSSDPEDEIPLDIIKNEIVSTEEGALPSTSTAEDQPEEQLNNPSQGVSKNKKQKTAISIKRVYSNNIYKCAQCNKVLNSKEILTKHLKTHEINKKNKGKKNNGHTKIQTKSYQGDKCQKNCESSYKLKKHIVMHCVEKSFKCDFCDKSFIEKCDLKTHLIIHKNKEGCVCPICKETFDFKHMLTSHIKKTHNAEKLYKCETCNKNFKNDNLLNRHRLIHADEKLYKCHICSKLYLNNIDLQRHIRVHSKLKPYQCYICKTSFRDESYLINHSRVHSGEKPYQCDLCHKAFVYKNGFKVHRRLHNEKPYKFKEENN